MSINKNKIERAAVRAVEEYIDSCSRLEPAIQSNDKTPIWDGDIYIYDNTERHKVEDFSALVRLQIKGTTTAESSSFRIDRIYVEAYKAEMGTVLLVHQQREGSSKLFYAILTLKKINALLQQSTKTIKIDLKEVPADPPDFEEEIIQFAFERSGQPVENPSPKEIVALVKRFKDIEQHLDRIEDKGVRIELQSFLNTIKGLKNDGTVGWRDTFVHLARKVLDLTIHHVNGYDTLDIQFELAKYLNHQKLYHVAENYYLQALEMYRERAKSDSIYKANVANTLNNLGVLYDDLKQYNAAEKKHKEALEIYRNLAKGDPDVYLADVAISLNNHGNLHHCLKQYDLAEAEYEEALKIQRKLAKDNPDVYLADIAMTLNNIGILHNVPKQRSAAEAEFREALIIYRKLAKDNPDTYLADVAMTLNNLGNLHKSINQNNLAEEEYKEAIEIRRKLAEDNPNAYLADVARALHNLGNLHDSINQYDDAEKEYKEALQIFRKLTKDNPDAYLVYMVTTLNSLGNLHDSLNQYDDAEKEYKETLEVYRKLAKVNPNPYLAYVATTLSNIAGMFWKVNQFNAAFSKLKEALEIRRKLAEDNQDAYLPDVARTLYNMALLFIKDTGNKKEAKQACQEALDLYKVMAEKAPQRFNKDVEKTQELLDQINGLE